MRWLLLFVLVVACAPAEYGEVTVSVCPPCPDAYAGFSTCAFFDADAAWARPGMLIDEKQYDGVGTPVRIPGYMHHKFCFNETHAVFGSANPTENGLFLNQNLVVVFASATMAQNFASEYAYLQGDRSGRQVRDWMFNGRPVTQLFCPRDSCEKRILAVLSEAETSILFLTFSFTSDPIGALLREKHAQGVEVRGIMEGRNVNGLGSEFAAFRDAGIAVYAARTPGVMHHKAFVVDGTTAIIGSYNPSKNADTRNAETVVVTQEPAIVAALLFEFSRLVSQTI